MPTAADNLRAIKTFPDLVRYLEDELDWPLQEYGFDELTFEYSPAELGLRDEDAAKVRAIHQLRPMADGQPFGIFFVEFERKRMPVVVLRRILSHLVLKQRASANRANSAAWSLGDLLFISAFGDEASDQREIAFAHFHQDAGDLPTLRVLGWDGADTGLKLDYVANVLHERLCWPADPANVDAWRELWSHAFRHRLGHVIRTSDALADRLAALARRIRYAAITLMNHESERGPLRQLHKAFQTALIHDLTEADFADTYAQTVTYGLLTAAISRTDMSGGRYGTVLLAGDITEMVPVTNPFLKEMLGTFLQAGGQKGGINFDELGVQDVVELLRGDETDLPAILRDFGNRTRGEDPVIHFYEHFLAAYDKQLKVQRGIFYTPQPVVSYIVRSVHKLLQTEFGLEDGLASIVTWGEMAARFPGLKIPEGTDPASPFVVILDPATGTATFLVEVIEVIFRTLTAKWKAQRLTEAQQRDAWNEYVPRHLLPRLHGYELMMAPYAIAHMKIGLKLFETGYRFGSIERVRVYLTNALEPASDERQQLAFAGWAPALAHEAQAVYAIKRYQRFTVVIGNPPYSGNSSNRGEWIESLINDYRKVDGKPLGEVKVWLKDDYVKFMRFAERVLAQTGFGILGFITNNSFFDGLTFRGMRQHLLAGSSRGYFLNLHGNGNLKEQAPDGTPDENVFDILQGVGISLLVNNASRRNLPSTFAGDIYGTREDKYEILRTSSVTTGAYAVSAPRTPNYFVICKNEEGSEEYQHFTPIPTLFEIGGLGFQSHRDSFVVAFSEEELVERMKIFYDLRLSDSEIRERFGIDDFRRFQIGSFRRANRFEPISIQRVQYRPFDYRYVYYARDIVQEWQIRFHSHLLHPNLGLNVMRQTKAPCWQHVMVSKTPTPAVFVEIKDGSSQFPLYCYGEFEGLLFSQHNQSRIPNLNEHLVGTWLGQIGVSAAWPNNDRSGSAIVATYADDIFHYIYAVFHSPAYRTRYVEFLKIDFPRVPLTGSLDLFRGLAALGGELVALHLLESPALAQHITTYTGPAAPAVEKVTYADGTVWLDKAQTAGFRGVPAAVWAFHIGGYQVCEKWLKDRKGRTLSSEDVEHYQRVVVALNETIRVMGEIDAVIEDHGGWPIQ